MSWTDQAACRGEDTELFYPTFAGDHGAEAKKICARCTVRNECLTDAMRTEGGWHFGIRGGLSANQRAQLARAAS